ncbi:MAG: 2-oxoacid:acceptor oxidoreductase subunit alpha [Deltaproteobacteria bacterium]|nr:2-oxoacid:acceptor oxidoreductase subunit alpha [Deltaproteobacteria bacterium]
MEEAGARLPATTTSTKTDTDGRRRYTTGNEAAAHGALAAGCRFYAGYPITPSSEIMETLAELLPRAGGVFVQMEDEIASISAVIGASWTGAKAMTATSGPGFSLMMEALGYAVFTETPCVIVDVQRAGPCTGQATRVGGGDVMQCKWGMHGDVEIVALAPWSVQEMYDLSVRAFNVAERLRLPVFLMADEAVGHLHETAEFHDRIAVEQRDRRKGFPPFGHGDPGGVPPMPCFGDGENLLVTGSTHDERGYRKVEEPQVHARLVERLRQKVLLRRDELVDVERYMLDDAETVIVAYGFTARGALAAARELRGRGRKVGLLRLRTLWPFADKEVAALDGRARRVFVPEMNHGQVLGEVRKHFRGDVAGYGQTDGEVIPVGTIVREVERLT